MKSRKFLLTGIGSLLIEVVASVAFFIDKMDSSQWINFNQWLWPLTLGIFCGTTVWEKFAYRKPGDPK